MQDDKRTISTTTFDGTWPKPYYCSEDEDYMDDSDDSFHEIASDYFQKKEEEKTLSRKKNNRS